jgi:hypothetical protein
MGGKFVSRRILPVQDVLTNCRAYFVRWNISPSSGGL